MSSTRSIFYWLVLALGLCAQVMAQAEEGDDDVSQIPQRPVGQILDGARWFSAEEKESAQKELDRLFTENQIDVYLVTLAKQPPQGALTYARKLGESWSRAPVWCVVFHVPGDPAGFHVEYGGVEIDRKQMDQAVTEASKRANRENTEKDRVMAAWKECSEELRFVHASGKLFNERVVEVKKEMRSDHARNQKLKKLIPAVALAGLIFLAIVTYFIVRTTRSKRFTFVFPETSWRTRFQGPHSGGSGIVVNYRRKRLK